jgi:hypoxanthine phosphoribosyltransferase
MEVSSYGAGTQSSGVVRILKDLEEDITGRHVLLVEDIIDTGLTLSYLRRALLQREPASLEICALLTKPSRRQVDLRVRYLGFEVPDEFVIGYGIDFAGAYRNLPDIHVLKPEESSLGSPPAPEKD